MVEISLMAARRTLGLSQKAMAKRLGIDPGTLQAWESGKAMPIKEAPADHR